MLLALDRQHNLRLVCVDIRNQPTAADTRLDIGNIIGGIEILNVAENAFVFIQSDLHGGEVCGPEFLCFDFSKAFLRADLRILQVLLYTMARSL